jgi:hypothetical protein
MKQRSRWWFLSFATCLVLPLALTVACPVWSQTSAEPVIDMHLHAKHADELGPPPLYLCAPFLSWPVKDTHEDAQTYFARVQESPFPMTHTMSAAPEISRLTHAVASAAPAASSLSAMRKLNTRAIRKPFA